MAEKNEIVLQVLQTAGKPLKAGDIATMTGLPKDEVAKILAKLKKEGKIESPKACFYTAK